MAKKKPSPNCHDSPLEAHRKMDYRHAMQMAINIANVTGNTFPNATLRDLAAPVVAEIRARLAEHMRSFDAD